MVYRIVVGLLTIIGLVVNVRLYRDTSQASIDREVLQQLNYLEAALQGGAGDEMQALFPEGFFFTHVLYGLTWVELSQASSVAPQVRDRALDQARWALEQLESAEGTRVYDQALDPPYGIFYAGWHTWLEGGLLTMQDAQAYDSTDVERFIANCERLAMAFAQRETPFLESYRGAAWPSDALVGIAALRLHDRLFAPRFEHTTTEWLTRVKSRLDPATRLIPHEARLPEGGVAEGARGSSQSLMLRFLIEVDAAFAQVHYRRFRRQFVSTRGGIPGVREYAKGTSGPGDIDSGPVVFDLGAAATIVTLGTARTYGDQALADPLLQTIESLGLPLSPGGKKRYLFGQLPIGDAFLAWSKVARPHQELHTVAPYAPVGRWWWRLPFHGITFVLVMLVWIPVVRSKYRSS